MQTLEHKNSIDSLIRKEGEFQIRQGDVLLRRVLDNKEIKNPEKLISTGSMVVQEGEMTGHAHRLQAKGNTQVEILANIEDPDEKYVVVADGQSLINHEEHNTVSVEPGVYKVLIEREHDPTTGMNRRVWD